MDFIRCIGLKTKVVNLRFTWSSNDSLLMLQCSIVFKNPYDIVCNGHASVELIQDAAMSM